MQLVGEFVGFVRGVGISAGGEGEEEVGIDGEGRVEEGRVRDRVERDVFDSGRDAEAAGERAGRGGEGEEFRERDYGVVGLGVGEVVGAGAELDMGS